jgi:hypothetical protein
MATKKKAPQKNLSQSGLLSCTNMWRVYVSAELMLIGEEGELKLRRVERGVEGAQQAEVRVTDNTDQIVLHEGFDPEGNKAIFMVRVPQSSQIFMPKKNRVPQSSKISMPKKK